MHALCLDHLTLWDSPAAELVEVAARLECSNVSLFAIPFSLAPYDDLINDKGARARVSKALRANGITVRNVEPFMIEEATDWALLARLADLAAELGGQINALCFDPDHERLADSICRLAQIAEQVAVDLIIEAFPMSAVRRQEDALALARAAGNGVGLCVDTLHVMRSGGSWRDVAALPPELVRHVQLSDGPLPAPSDLYLEAAYERLPPGAGDFDLRALLDILPGTAVLAVEAPYRAPPGMSPEHRARVAVEATRALLPPDR